MISPLRLLPALVLGSALLSPGGTARAQNLVLNGGFEEYEACPAFLGQVDGYLTGWNRTGLGSTDYQPTQPELRP